MRTFSARGHALVAAFLSAAMLLPCLQVSHVQAAERTASDFKDPVTLVSGYPDELGPTDGPYPYGPYGTTAAQLSAGMGVMFAPDTKYGPFEDLYAHYIGSGDGFNPAIPAYCVQFDVLLDGSASKTPGTSFDSLTNQQQRAITLALAFSPDLTIPDYSADNAGTIPKDTYLSWLGVQQLIWNIAGSDENGYTPIGSSRSQASGEETDAADFPLLSGQSLENAKLLSQETGSYDTDGILLDTYRDTAKKVMSAASYASHAAVLDGSSLELQQASSYTTEIYIGKNMDPDLLQISCPKSEVSLSYNPSDGMLRASIPLEKASDVSTTVTLRHLLPASDDSAVYFSGGGQVVTAHRPKTVLNAVTLHLTIEKPKPSVTPFSLQIIKTSSAGNPLAGAVFSVSYQPESASVTDSDGSAATARTWYLKTGSDGTAGFSDLDPDRVSSPLYPADASGCRIPAGTLTAREIQAPAGYETDPDVKTISSSGDGFTAPVVFSSDPFSFSDAPAALAAYSTSASWYSTDTGSIGKEISGDEAEDSGNSIFLQDTVTWKGASAQETYQVHTELFDTNHPEMTAKTWDTEYRFSETDGSGVMNFPLTAQELAALGKNSTWQLRQTLSLNGQQAASETSPEEQIHITQPSLEKSTDHPSHSMDETYLYSVEITIPGDPSWPCQSASIDDTLPAGVRLVSGSATLAEGGAALDSSLYTVTETSENQDRLSVSFSEEALAEYSGRKLTLTYYAEIRESAPAQTSLVNHVTYTTATPGFIRTLTDETSVYTGSAAFAKTNGSGTPVAGAVFRLLHADGTAYLLHRDSADDGSEYTAVSDSSGHFTFTGLADGTYQIQEAEVPEGSSLLTSPFTIRIQNGTLSEDSPEKIENPEALTLHAGGPGIKPVLFLSAMPAAVLLLLLRRKRPD